MSDPAAVTTPPAGHVNASTADAKLAAAGQAGPTKTAEPPNPTVAATESPKPAQPDAGSRRFVELTRREQGLVQRELGLKAKEKAIQTRQAEAEAAQAELQRYKQIEERGKAQPDLVLKSLFGDQWFEKLTDLHLKGATGTDPAAILETVESRVDQRLTKFEQAQKTAREQEQRARQEAQQRATQEIFEQTKNEIREFVDSNAETYQLTKLYDAGNLAFELIEQNFSRNQRVLSIKEACDLVETYYEDEVERALATPKVTAKHRSPTQPASSSGVRASQRAPGLTDDLTAVTTPPKTALRTEDERIRDAYRVLSSRDVKKQ